MDLVKSMKKLEAKGGAGSSTMAAVANRASSLSGPSGGQPKSSTSSNFFTIGGFRSIFVNRNNENMDGRIKTLILCLLLHTI